MKSGTSLALAVPRPHWADLLELTKPRIAVMVLFTVAAGAWLAQPEMPAFWVVANAVVGAGLLAAGASVLNQVLEKGSDALMRRTENRPLPTGRVHPAEAVVLGLVLSAGGMAYLLLTGRHPLAAWIGLFTLVGYVLVYTPIKRHTTLNTLIGAVPGALPPVIGWTAVTGSLDAGALALFLILFLWQVPHFLAIAWIYREDYGRAGLKMLPVVDPQGSACGRQMVLYCLALLPVSLLPLWTGHAGLLFGLGGMVLGLMFLRSACGFWKEVNNQRARKVLYASLFYLPAALGLWLADHWLRMM